MKRRAALTTILTLLACAPSAGCYKEVTKAKGIGSDTIYPRRAEPSENKIDQTLDKILKPESKK